MTALPTSLLRSYLGIIVFAVGGILCGYRAASASTAPKASAKRPNFLFIYTDDQRYDAMSFVQRQQGEKGRYPWFKTPHMDRLAQEGAWFRNAFVTLSLCAPSRATYLTGQYNHQNGVTNNFTPFPESSITYASLLREAGYTTAYVGKWHMGNQSGQRPGFTYSASYVGQGKYEDCAFEINGQNTPTQGWVDDVSTDYAIEFLKQNRDKPFAVVVGFKTPHVPLIPPERAKNRFEGETWRRVPNMQVRAIYRGPPGPKDVPATERPTNLNYFRCLSAIDDNVGRMLATLDELGLAEDTVVVYASDNGYYQGEHHLGDKRSAYDESLRIPLILRYPRGVAAGTVVDKMVLNLDLAPTFLDMASVPPHADMQGMSWLPLLQGKKTHWRSSFLYEYFLEPEYPTTPDVLALRTDTAKLIMYPGRDDWTEVFDLERDPYETVNLANNPAHAALRARLEKEFEIQKKAVGFRSPPPSAGASKASPAKPAPTTSAPAITLPPPLASATHLNTFIDRHCASCHDDIEKKGGLDLTSLTFTPGDPKNFAKWLVVHDRVQQGEMPPKEKKRPAGDDMTSFLGDLSNALKTAEVGFLKEGRATQRRLNRYEYENAVRDLLGAPWLQVKAGLPEDGEKYRFNKIGDTLDISHVNMARYLVVAEDALRQVVARELSPPQPTVTRYYARDQRSFAGKMTFSVFNRRPERATFPVLGTEAQPDVRATKAPITVGPADPVTREREAMGVVASSYEPIELRFEKFKAPVSGRYKIRVSAYSVWVGAGKPVEGKTHQWWIPDFDDVSPGRRPEPITFYSETPPRSLRRLGAFDFGTEPTTHELDVYLLAGEMIRPDCVRLFRSRPSNWQNPLATREGQPGVAFRWMEVEGPLQDEWPSKGHRLMFGNLRLSKTPNGKGVDVVSEDPQKDAPRLLRSFTEAAYRRPVTQEDLDQFLPVIQGALASGSSFTDAMIAGYTAVLCSPGFLFLDEKPGRLEDHALASRLAFFLWNTAPDTELRHLADEGRLRTPAVLKAQTERLLCDPRSRQFVEAFLDYWLDLRKLQATSPDSALYNDYYLDDALVEAAQEETQLFFSELLAKDLPARSLISTDFAFVNERLADHYGLPHVDGIALQKVTLPVDSPRGGLLTQASVLKVTANGTSTSPVLRGTWIMERILGMPPPPPPPNLPAVEPDIRGAHTIRQQLDLHRTEASCAACHAKIDPPGFALENFDVMGGWRSQYRAIDDKVAAVAGFGKNGLKFAFHYGLPVDASGELWDGQAFHDIKEFKALLLKDERLIARNLLRQLALYATGSPARFTDRDTIESILTQTQASHYGVRDLIHGLVQSDLFLNK